VGVRLDVDVQAHLGPGGQQVVQAGHHAGPADPDGGQVRPAQIGDPPGRAGQAQQRAVVEDDRHAVRCGVHVRFEIPVAQRHRPPERLHRVLVPVGGAAPVRERQRRGRVEKAEALIHRRSMRDPHQSRRAKPGSMRGYQLTAMYFDSR
jgi:hypothetical protein